MDITGLGLEIGASHSPLLPKSTGARIQILDHATREELVAKYRGEVADELLDQIEDVDYVSNAGSLVDAVGKTGVFDYIVCSHVIEHTVDLVGFLADCEALLKPTGKLSLIVPDQRFCFDLLRPWSGIGEVIDAHLYRQRFHTPGSLVEYATCTCKRGGETGWAPEDAGPVELRFPEPIDARALVQQGIDQAEYHDVHHWRFTPASFSFLVQELRELGYHSLYEDVVDRPPSFEFYVTLARREVRPPRRDRLELLQQIRKDYAYAADVDRLPPSIALYEQALADARGEIAAARGEIADARGELAEDRRELADARGQIEKLEILAAEQEAANEALRRQLDSVLSSRSWRLTAPMRGVKGTVRRKR